MSTPSNYDKHVNDAWSNKVSVIIFPASTYFPLMIVSVLWSLYSDRVDSIVSYSVYSAMFVAYLAIAVLSVVFLYARPKSIPVLYKICGVLGFACQLILVGMCYALMCFYHAMQSCDATIATTPLPLMALIHLRILLPGTHLGLFIIAMSLLLIACIPLMNPTCYFSSIHWIKTFIPELVWFLLCTAICFIDNLSFRAEDRDAFRALNDAKAKYETIKVEHATCAKLLENILPPEYKQSVLRECESRIVATTHQRKSSPMLCIHLDFMVCMAIDGVHFTNFCRGKPAERIVQTMGRVFAIIDDLIETSLYARKIKQVGDASLIYFQPSPSTRSDDVLSEQRLCLEAVGFGVSAMNSISTSETTKDLQFRCGIANGKGTLFVIGEQRISFDCVGSSKSLADKMESTGVPNMIQCSRTVATNTLNYYKYTLEDGKFLLDPKSHIPEGQSLVALARRRSVSNSLSISSLTKRDGLSAKIKSILAPFGINVGIKPMEIIFGVDMSGGVSKLIDRAEDIYMKKRFAHLILFAVITVALFAVLGSLILSEYPESATIQTTNNPILITVGSLAILHLVLAVLYGFLSKFFLCGYVLCNLSHFVMVVAITVAFFFDHSSSVRFSSAFVFTLDAAVACQGVYFFPAEILFLMIVYNGALISAELIFVPIVFETSILDALSANWMYYMTTPVACMLFVLGEYLTRYTSLSKHRDTERALRYDKKISRKVSLAQTILASFLPQHVIAHYRKNTLAQCSETFSDAVVLICTIKDFSANYSADPTRSVISLHRLFSAFDSAQKTSALPGVVLEKVKSSGEQYIAFARREDACEDKCQCALTACKLAIYMKQNAEVNRTEIQIGLSVGEVCSCVVGTKKYQYDIYSSAVNMAARLSALDTQLANPILCQREMAELFPIVEKIGKRGRGLMVFEPIGSRTLKGIGEVPVFQLECTLPTT